MTNLQSIRVNNRICNSYYETYDLIARTVETGVSEVLISEINTDWLYKLFPTIFYWRMKNAKVKLILKKNTDDSKHGPYRRRLLEAMGIETLEVESLPFRGYLFNPNNEYNSFTIIRNERTKPDSHYDGVTYTGKIDYSTIKVFSKLFNEVFGGKIINKYDEIEILRTDPNAILNLLKKGVHQYNHDYVKLELLKIDISKVRTITKFVTGYKYTQVNKLYELFDSSSLDYFYPAKISYGGGKETYITPPVLEKHGDLFLALEGITRFTYAYNNKIGELYCIVATGVKSPLPSSGIFELKEMVISDEEIEGSRRYENFNYQNFRSIEKSIRNPSTELI
jgi:hypothetical protein